ncbi:MAG: exopolysaccharide production protein ExoY [Candidatus Poriferisodalaceae bacterium]|jgi:exopolysaccharide production protein ExoY
MHLKSLSVTIQATGDRPPPNQTAKSDVQSSWLAEVVPLASPRQRVLAHRARSSSQRQLGTTRVFDVIGALAALVVFLPVIAAVLLVVKATSRGPAFFVQQRVGRNGRPFDCLKFRTMRVGADAELSDMLKSDPELRAVFAEGYKLPEDPRITKVGRLLRSLSLDELPQIINVLRGDMSLVGPRPVVPEELWRYGDRGEIVLMVRPGMTGPWQVGGRNDISYDERIELDTDYALSRTLRLDISILFRTATSMVGGFRGAY